MVQFNWDSERTGEREALDCRMSKSGGSFSSSALSHSLMTRGHSLQGSDTLSVSFKHSSLDNFNINNRIHLLVPKTAVKTTALTVRPSSQSSPPRITLL